MLFRRGEKVLWRVIHDVTFYRATVVLQDGENFILKLDEMPAIIKPSSGQDVIVRSGCDDYYTQVIGFESENIILKPMWAERREYFRVDDVMPVVVTRVCADKGKVRSMLLSVPGVEGVPAHEVHGEHMEHELYNMLIEINAKIDFLMNNPLLEKEGLLKAKPKAVNISACGMRFTTKDPADAGDRVEIKMLLPVCPPVPILAYGEVVRVHALEDGTYELAVQFTDMDDEVRDAIIQYALKRQREIIRRQKGLN